MSSLLLWFFFLYHQLHCSACWSWNGLVALIREWLILRFWRLHGASVFTGGRLEEVKMTEGLQPLVGRYCCVRGWEFIKYFLQFFPLPQCLGCAFIWRPQDLWSSVGQIKCVQQLFEEAIGINSLCVRCCGTGICQCLKPQIHLERANEQHEYWVGPFWELIVS